MSITNRQTSNPTELFDPTPYGFAHSIKVENPAAICFISGQSGGTGRNHELSPDFRTQVRAALQNLKLQLEAQSFDLQDVVKITLLIVDHNADKLAIWSEEAGMMWDKTALPTSTLIPVQQLALSGMLFEIDAIAQKI
ncbi:MULTISPECIES: RidA family protein [Sphingobacterium]|uniref:RidA family protein n=1 Tax=Sphingobacterium populi TaxID=1812824 RepID=A0ABW5U7W5_9SPHI|nr:RidA family protein [Sphingobacterium sp. CFCC 11742]